MGGGRGLQATELQQRLPSHRTKNSIWSCNKLLEQNNVGAPPCHEEAANIRENTERLVFSYSLLN